MLARIANDLYWLGRHLVRAEHTARMLDALFQAELEALTEDPSSVAISWRSVPVLMGAGSENGAPADAEAREAVTRQLTTDERSPVSIVSCVTAAREEARTLRDTISTEMWEALNKFFLELHEPAIGASPRTGPHSVYAFVKERCALFWGLSLSTMQRDEARSFLIAGGRTEAADMVLRMLRVALPPIRPAEDESRELPRRDGNALALLRAVGGTQAYMRSAAAPPNAEPVAWFLLLDDDFPESVAASAEALHRSLTRADPQPAVSPPILRLRRLIADLELRRHARIAYEELPGAFREIQDELHQVEREIEKHYFTREAPGDMTPLRIQ
jgi:uncharacterized alpha-E superfamily protein